MFFYIPERNLKNQKFLQYVIHVFTVFESELKSFEINAVSLRRLFCVCRAREDAV